jgi:hypothetical protein
MHEARVQEPCSSSLPVSASQMLSMNVAIGLLEGGDFEGGLHRAWAVATEED